MKKFSPAVIAAALSVIIMAVIFCFSGKDASASSGQSLPITRLLCRIIFFGFKGMDSGDQVFLTDALHPFVRKLAHFCVYALLGASVYAAAEFSRLRGIAKMIVSQVICTAYAVFDEVHQSFIPGRAMMLRDVLLDSFGAFCGMIICGIVIIIYRYYFCSKNKNEI